MKLKLRNLTTLLCLGLVTSCGIKFHAGKDSDKKNDSGKSLGKSSVSESKSLSYDFTENGCNTGKHTFNSVAELCAGLRNSALNKGCALTLRREYYKQNGCTEAFDPVATPPGPSVPSNPTPSPEANDAARLAQEAFDLTWVKGHKEYSLKDAVVKVEIKDTLTQQTRKNITIKCSSTSPMIIDGKLSEVSFQIGNLECSNDKEVKSELMKIKLALSKAVYRPRHIPAGESNFSQFGLDLVSLDQQFREHAIRNPRQQNAIIQKGTVFFDVVGKARSLMPSNTRGLLNFYSLFFVPQKDGTVELEANFALESDSGSTVNFTIKEKLR